jgi:hypothetical protein
VVDRLPTVKLPISLSYLHQSPHIMVAIADQQQKPHRPAQKGKSAEKKDAKKGVDKSGGRKGFNEKVGWLLSARPGHVSGTDLCMGFP